jgi:hypothetical protein
VQGRQLWRTAVWVVDYEGVRLTLLNGVLLAMIGMAIVGIQGLDRSGASVEGSVRRYASAISNADLQAALAEISPDQRATWEGWVRGQLGNVYDVKGIAVRSPSVVDRVLKSPTVSRFEVTAILDVNRDYPEFYQPSPTVAVEDVNGRWYLHAPLLAPRTST